MSSSGMANMFVVQEIEQLKGKILSLFLRTCSDKDEAEKLFKASFLEVFKTTIETQQLGSGFDTQQDVSD